MKKYLWIDDDCGSDSNEEDEESIHADIELQIDWNVMIGLYIRKMSGNEHETENHILLFTPGFRDRHYKAMC